MTNCPNAVVQKLEIDIDTTIKITS